MTNPFLPLLLSTTMLFNSFTCICEAKAHDLHHANDSIANGTQPLSNSTFVPLGSTVGGQDFKLLATTGKIVVDKTPLIKEIALDDHRAILITRPRRWGKSVNFNMIKYFFNIEVDSNGDRILPNPNRVLFTGGGYTFRSKIEKDGKLLEQTDVVTLPPLQISEDQDFIAKYQGRYPSVLLDLKNVVGRTYQSVENHLRGKISQIFGEHPYLLNSLHEQSKDHSDYDKQRDALLYLDKFNSIRAERSSVKDLQGSLGFLSELLYTYHNAKAYILVDEYDTPLHEVSFDNQALSDVTSLLRELFGSACKNNDVFVEKCLFTGILRIAQANLLSGLNNPGVYTLLDSKYAPYYGFTQEEVDKLFKGKKMGDFSYPADGSIVPEHPLNKGDGTEKKKSISHTPTLKEELERIYNGYLIGDIKLYNPWSIVNVLTDKVLKPYWVDSGGISYIKEALFSDKANAIWNSVKGRKSFLTEITRDVSISDIRNPESLASLLFHAGYLTLTKNQVITNGQRHVVIPNEEVNREFARLLNRYAFKELQVSQFENIQNAFDAILRQDVASLDAALSTLGEPVVFTTAWNFDFLRAAALRGNETIFNRVLRYDAKLLKNVGADGLSVADYALLGKQNDDRLTGFTPLVQQPSLWKRWVACPLGTAAVMTAGGVAGFAYHYLFHHPIGGWRFLFGFLGGFGLEEFVMRLEEKEVFSDCKGYRAYNKIDISKPASIHSFKQLEKYIIQNPGAYVSLNGDCGKDFEKRMLRPLNISAVNIQSIPSVTLSLMLCKQKGVKEEL